MLIAIIAAITILSLLIMAIFLLKGKGAFLIAGYNTMKKAEREQYDQKALCRFMGKVLLIICICMTFIFAGVYLGTPWLVYIGVVITLVFSFGSAVYANTGKRFLKKNAEPRVVAGIIRKSKASMITVSIISVVLVIGLGVLFYQGEREPIVNVFDDSVQIRAMYGLTIDFSEIRDISLLEQSMRDIGVGRRTNGYNAGGALKGHFTSGLLFVQASISPTIRIERNDATNIYINFRNSEQTKILYNELIQKFR